MLTAREHYITNLRIDKEYKNVRASYRAVLRFGKTDSKEFSSRSARSMYLPGRSLEGEVLFIKAL